jgi:chromosomal replication initiator protein
MDLVKAWENAQISIKNQVGKASYETWFSGLNTKEESPQILLIEAPDEFFKTWLVDHYSSIIQDLLRKEAGQDVVVKFDVHSLQAENLAMPKILAAPKNSSANSTATTTRRGGEINHRFSFNNFVVGPGNRFAYAASLAVAESPAKAYNPLFIYGSVGLGKTHLMQATTGYIQKHHPQLKHCYISSEQFTNELINAIRHKTTIQFRQKYRNIDVLLIDDIHFIAGKESTQEEFFHTFNTLHDNRKQIIICSDRPPKEISKLEERLVSRFAWGLITDIQPPDFETRVAILRKKLELEPAKVPQDVIYFIAEQIKTNIRELEGALIRVVACSLLEDRAISLDMAKNVLKDMVKESVKIISVEMIQKKVSEFFSITLVDLKSSRRQRHLVLPRQVAMYLARKLTKHSLPEIGNTFGGKDHTTVMHSCKKIEQDINTDVQLRKTVEQLTTGLMT